MLKKDKHKKKASHFTFILLSSFIKMYSLKNTGSNSVLSFDRTGTFSFLLYNIGFFTGNLPRIITKYESFTFSEILHIIMNDNSFLFTDTALSSHCLTERNLSMFYNFFNYISVVKLVFMRLYVNQGRQGTPPTPGPQNPPKNN